MKKKKMRSQTPFLDLFDKILTEASKTFRVPKEKVTFEKFLMVSNRRIGSHTLRTYGYAKLRDVVAPGKNRELKDELAVLKRIMENA